MSDFVRWFTGGDSRLALVDFLLVCMLAWQMMYLLAQLFWLAVGNLALRRDLRRIRRAQVMKGGQ